MVPLSGRFGILPIFCKISSYWMSSHSLISISSCDNLQHNLKSMFLFIHIMRMRDFEILKELE